MTTVFIFVLLHLSGVYGGDLKSNSVNESPATGGTLGCEFNRERVIDETPLIFTAVAGSLAVLPCSVDPRYAELYAEHYKVIWVSPLDTIVSLQDRRIINDIRISVERPYLKNWNLHIRNVSLSDAGVYKCQINTDPVGTKKINLVVTDPPRIIDHSVPTDVKKPEGDKVQLFCNATGSPIPEITWYRLFRKDNGKRQRVGKTGEFLVIHNISRKCGDYYECLASNGIEPAISQTFRVTVLYRPAINLPNTRIGQHLGRDTILDCEVSASPLGYAIWKRHDRSLANSKFHEVHIYNNADDSITLSLRILKVEPEDFGFYDCEATNPLGVTRKSMELFELVSKTSEATSPTAVTTFRYTWINGKGNHKIEVDTTGDRSPQLPIVNKSVGQNGQQSGENNPSDPSNGSVISGFQISGPSDNGPKHSGSADSSHTNVGGVSSDGGILGTGHFLLAAALTTISRHKIFFS